MSADTPERPSGSRKKDRLVQTRVPRDLAETLKDEAARQRLTVSHLIRNVLEDAFELVDGVVADVDQFVNDSVTLARRLSGGGGRDRSAGAAEAVSQAGPGDDLSHVYAWNEVVLHRSTTCSTCGTEMARGARAYAGLSDQSAATRAWLCETCIDELAD